MNDRDETSALTGTEDRLMHIRQSNACATLEANDCEALWEAAHRMLDARNIVIRLTEQLGDATAWASGKLTQQLKQRFGFDVSAKIDSVLQELLWSFQSGAMTGLEADGPGDRWGWLHKALVVVSGATGGFAGLPGLLWDLPVTTTLIMRSVADVARSFEGEDITSDATKRACIEVFAFGSPMAEDDEAEQGYWATRIGLNHTTIELLIKQVAARFGITVSEKALAQAVPVVSAMSGAGLNFAFIDYYQEMARVHFAIRAAERRAADPSAVRPCFSAMVRGIRADRASRQQPARRVI